VPATRAKRRIVEAKTNARRHFAAGGNRDQQVAARQIIALGDGKRRRHDFRSDVRHGRPVHVAHRDRGDQIAVEQRGAHERQRRAADHARFRSLRQRRCQTPDLIGLFALVTRERAGERIQDQVLAMLAGPLGQIVVAQPGGEVG
jgi:hypothetical protein